MKCPNCSKDTITYKLVAQSSVDDPILCDSCRQQIFQYRFITETGQSYGMLSFQLGIILLVFQDWLYGVLFFIFALVGFIGAQYIEINFTRLRVLAIGEKRPQRIQPTLSFLAMIIGLIVFIPFLIFLPDDNEFINFIFQFLGFGFS